MIEMANHLQDSSQMIENTEILSNIEFPVD